MLAIDLYHLGFTLHPSTSLFDKYSIKGLFLQIAFDHKEEEFIAIFKYNKGRPEDAEGTVKSKSFKLFKHDLLRLIQEHRKTLDIEDKTYVVKYKNEQGRWTSELKNYINEVMRPSFKKFHEEEE